MSKLDSLIFGEEPPKPAPPPSAQEVQRKAIFQARRESRKTAELANNELKKAEADFQRCLKAGKCDDNTLRAKAEQIILLKRQVQAAQLLQNEVTRNTSISLQQKIQNTRVTLFRANAAVAAQAVEGVNQQEVMAEIRKMQEASIKNEMLNECLQDHQDSLLEDINTANEGEEDMESEVNTYLEQAYDHRALNSQAALYSTTHNVRTGISNSSSEVDKNLLERFNKLR